LTSDPNFSGTNHPWDDPKRHEATRIKLLKDKIYELTQEIEKAPLLFETKGTSMYPTIKEGDVCICMQKDSYKANDIVVFFMKLDDEYIGIAHRIIGINGENITTRGDNNEFLDAQIKQENILCTIPEVPKYAYNLK